MEGFTQHLQVWNAEEIENMVIFESLCQHSFFFLQRLERYTVELVLAEKIVDNLTNQI